MIEKTAVATGIQFLAKAGLNLFASIPCQTLPEPINTLMQKAGVPLGEYNSLVMLGHGGKQLWESMSAEDWATPNPIDSYSQGKAEAFINTFLDGAKSLPLFPNGFLIPLQQLGNYVGWSHASPLGLGISSEFGVWFAYRAAFLTTAVLPEIRTPLQPSPCVTCLDKPCLTSCPGKATQPPDIPFNVEACATHRLKPKSTCSDRCLARMACPIAPEHQYTLPQIQYHYGLSLETFKTYFPHLTDCIE